MVKPLGFSLLAAVAAQQYGPLTPEGSVYMSVETCAAGVVPNFPSCTLGVSRAVMDMNWRWLHNSAGYDNCLTDSWDARYCPDPTTCAQNCALEGVPTADYTNNYKVTPIEKGIRLDYPKAPRVYLLEAEDRYKLFKLKNKEFTFDVDLSTLGCGLNAALYLVEMPQDGDAGGSNAAGAKYGTGYCDAQCPRMKFIRGQANTKDFKKRPTTTPELETVMEGPAGRYGYCCAEMDIFEGNSMAAAYTAHPCSVVESEMCDGKEQCGDKQDGITGVCDKDGCGFNSYRHGEPNFWGLGPDFTVDTSKPVTIVTQFVTSDNTDSGDLVEIRRLYIQDGKLIQNSEASALKSGGQSMTDRLCQESSKTFNATTDGFKELGGLKAMGEALGRGMVLSLSIWDDDLGRMLWLDGERSSIKEKVSEPGVRRGPCPFKYGSNKDNLAELVNHEMHVSFSNLKYGDIGSTYVAGSFQPAGLYKVEADSAALRGHGALAAPASRLTSGASAGAAAAAAAVLAALAALVLRRRGTSEPVSQILALEEDPLLE